MKAKWMESAFIIGVIIVTVLLTIALQRKAFVDSPQPKVIWVEVVCDECEGDGQVESQKCGYCDKDGMMQWKDGKLIKCLLCNGTGKRVGVCPYCGGKGKMYEERR